MRQRAIELRLAGLSTRQIAAALGVPLNSTLQGWLVGTPPPEWTRRPKAKDAERERAREMRAAGAPYPDIAAELGVSKSSVSLWVRDIVVPEELRQPPRDLGEISRAYWTAESLRRALERDRTKRNATLEIGLLNPRELLLVGVALYWAEGSKDKPYDRRERVVLTNSDDRVIRVFLRWLRQLEVPDEHIRYRLSIHESASVADALEYWARVVEVDAIQFDRPTLKTHKPRTARLNVGEHYHGCLVVSVLQSAHLYQQIEGWLRGIVEGAGGVDVRLGGDAAG